MRIVCVEDHPVLLEGLIENVKHIMPGANVSGFKRTDDALKFVSRHGCDVLFSEIELYGDSGLRFAEKVQEINPRVNIIFVTVCGENEHARDVMRLRPSGYLTKPVAKEQLQSELSNLRYQVC